MGGVGKGGEKNRFLNDLKILGDTEFRILFLVLRPRASRRARAVITTAT